MIIASPGFLEDEGNTPLAHTFVPEIYFLEIFISGSSSVYTNFNPVYLLYNTMTSCTASLQLVFEAIVLSTPIVIV